LNVKNRICHVSLREDMLVFLKFQDRLAGPYLGEKGFGIEPVIGELPHRRASLCSDERARLLLAPWPSRRKKKENI
jgi:hypothetical protein